MSTPASSLDCLLAWLLKERGEICPLHLSLSEKRRLLRGLINTRQPAPIPPKILALQDAELARQRDEKGIIDAQILPPFPKFPKIKLWQGDIARLKIDAIVNAANSQLLGCFIPCHNCIDNAIHSAAGLELREACAQIIQMQGHEEETGKAKITPGYNLPANWVIHTVGSFISTMPTAIEADELKSCYRECLNLANQYRLSSMAFCCISTGVFNYPAKDACNIAIKEVLDFLQKESDTTLQYIVFNVFSDQDYKIYQEELTLRTKD